MLFPFTSNLSNSFVLFPKELRRTHDRVQYRIKINTSVQLREDFNTAMKFISQHLDFELDDMRIIMPSSADGIIAEGNVLHHCFGNYIDWGAKHERTLRYPPFYLPSKCPFPKYILIEQLLGNHASLRQV